MREYYTITELTREFDVSTRTLRFYEDEGLVHPVRRGRTRLFRPSDRHLIRQIMRGNGSASRSTRSAKSSRCTRSRPARSVS